MQNMIDEEEENQTREKQEEVKLNRKEKKEQAEYVSLLSSLTQTKAAVKVSRPTYAHTLMNDTLVDLSGVMQGGAGRRNSGGEARKENNCRNVSAERVLLIHSPS